ncbi:MAG TPA: SMC-Scp complex subunit ScpB [Candidatus Bathyarchaeota archaeon]|nr:SMC-Scp complex subunit ScpB [Candidatus Bathyarchaeota archaeon]
MASSIPTTNASKSEKNDRKKRRRGKENIEAKLRLIEAALYVAGRPLDLKTLCNIIGSRSERKVQKLARTLMEDYRRRNTAIEIIELEDHRFVMQLKTEYSSKVRKLAIRPLLTSGPLRTLSYIAYKQPVTQKRVIEVRGKHAYKHIKELAEMGLITREKNGRDLILKTTDFFADYFGLSRNIHSMKRQLKRIFEKRGEETLPATFKVALNK